MSKFFIRRPIVAIVIAIVMTLVGSVCMIQLPISQYPNIVPPEIQVRANYTGADAQTIEQSVAAPIEQQMSGVDKSNYIQSVNANGSIRMTVNFDVATDPNVDHILTQMRVNQATSQAQSLFDVGKTEAASHFPALNSCVRHADTGIHHCYRRFIPHKPCRNAHFPTGETFADAMLDGVLDERLNDESGNAEPPQLPWHFDAHAKPVFEPGPLDVQVRFDQVQFFLDLRKLFAVEIGRLLISPSQQMRQPLAALNHIARQVGRGRFYGPQAEACGLCQRL